MKPYHYRWQTLCGCIFLLLCSITSFSQPVQNKTPDSISDKSWQAIMNKQFGPIATGQGEAVNLVNYGSFEPADGKFKFNFFGPLGAPCKGRQLFFNVSTSGSLTGDNIGALFSNSKLNTGFNITAKVHRQVGRHNSIAVGEVQIDEISEKIRLLQDERKIKKLEIEHAANINYLTDAERNAKARISGLDEESGMKKKEIDDLRRDIKAADQPGNQKVVLKLTDSLMTVNARLVAIEKDKSAWGYKLDSIQKIKTIIEGDLHGPKDPNYGNYVHNKHTAIDAEYDAKKDTLEQSMFVPVSNFHWISLVGKFDRNKYWTFYDSLPYADQLTKNKLSTFSYGLEYNFLYFDAMTSAVRYTNIGLVRMKANDVGDLTASELTESNKVAQGDSTRTNSTKYSVYTSPIEEYTAFKLYVNYYHFFGSQAKYAAHIFPDVEFRNTNDAPVNVGAGFIFSIKNKKDNAVLNIELYGKLVDLGKTLKTSESVFYNRNELGINIGLPFLLPSFSKK